jgi:hypothetical protein
VAFASFIGVDTDHPDLKDFAAHIDVDAVAVDDPTDVAESEVVGAFRLE